MSINLNLMAKDVAEQEVGQEVSIAQIKEVMKLTLNALAQEKPWEVLKLLDGRVKPAI